MRLSKLLLILILLTIGLAQNTDHSHNTSDNNEHHTTSEGNHHSTASHGHHESSEDTDDNNHHDTESDDDKAHDHGHSDEEHSEGNKIEDQSEERSNENHHGHDSEQTEEKESEDHSNHMSDSSETAHEHTEEHHDEIKDSEINDTDGMTESSEMSHDHLSNNNHSDHSEHGSHAVANDGTSANHIMLGEKMLSLFPLLSPEGNFAMVVQSESAGYTTSVAFEERSITTAFDEAGITQIDLGSAKQGTYTLTFRDSNNSIAVLVSIYKAFTPSGKAFTTIFAPSPSLSSRGQSEVFVYNIADGENQHQLVQVNYKMAGMTHSMDETITPLVHEHFDALKNAIQETGNIDTDPILANAMSNRSTLNFAMAGTWQFKVMVEGETLSFDIAMLNE